MKYVCDVCGWEYDEAEGCPDQELLPAQSLKICPTILFARSAA